MLISISLRIRLLLATLLVAIGCIAMAPSPASAAMEVEISAADSEIRVPDSTTVTATVSGVPEGAGTTYALYVQDADTDQILAGCWVGAGSCGAVVSAGWNENANPQPKHFTAFIASAQGPIGVSASTSVNVLPYHFNVEIAAGDSTIRVPDSTAITAQVTNPINTGGTLFAIYVVNADTDEVLANCWLSDGSCGAVVSAGWNENANPQPKHFKAFVASAQGPTGDFATTSVDVLPFEFDVEITAADSSIQVFDSTTVTAQVTSLPSVVDPNYTLWVRNDYTGQIINACGVAEACGGAVYAGWEQNGDPGPRSFSAWVSGPGDPHPSNVATVSVEVESYHFDVEITAADSSIRVPDSTTITAQVTNPVNTGGTLFAIYVVNADTDQVLASCWLSDGSCGAVVSAGWNENTDPQPKHFKAFVASAQGPTGDSATTSVDVLPYHFDVEITAAESSIRVPDSTTITAQVMNPVNTGGTLFAIYVVNADTDQVLANCWITSGSCFGVFSVGLNEIANPGPRHFKAFVASAQGPTGDEATTSVKIENPRSHVGDPDAPTGDPVDAISGNFALDRTDVRANGVTKGVEMTRVYNSRDSRTGELGNGWSWAGTERIELLTDGDVRVVRADGKTLDFAITAGGDFIAPYGHELTLVDEGSTYRLSDAYGSESTTFAQDGRVLSREDVNGRVISYERDQYGRLLRIVSAAQFVEFSYDVNGKLASATDSGGRTATYNYEGDYLVEVTDPEGKSITFEYDANGLMTEAVNPDGKLAVRNEYDADGRVTTQWVGASKPASFHYDDGQTTFTDSEGHEYKVHFDVWGKPDELEGPAGSEDEITRRADGRITSVTRADGKSTSYEYDGEGRVTRETDPAGAETHYTYDDESNLTSITNALGKTTTFTYDNDRNLESSTDPLGRTTTFEWSGPGVLTSRTDPLGRTTHYSRDSNERVWASTDPLGNTSYVSYNQQGQVASSTDPLMRTTSFEYSPMGRLVEEWNPSGSGILHEYDDAGNLTKTRYPYQIASTTEYDAFERPVLTRLNGEITSQTGYDDNNNELWTRDGLGSQTDFEYDSEGKLLSETSPEGAETSFEYDELGRKTKETDPRGKSTNYEYDDAGNVTAVVDATGARTTYTYDALGQMTSETDALGHVTSYEYDDAGQLVKETKPLGLITNYTYDAAGELTGKDVAGESVAYIRDSLGRITSAIPETGSTKNFTYDAAGQMTLASVVGGASVAFTYNLRGQVASTVDALGAATSYQYNALGDVVESTDAEGTTTYGYDGQGRLFRMVTPSGREHEFEYDAAGQITEQKIYRSGEQRTLVTDTMQEYDRDGRMTSAVTKNSGGQIVHELGYTYDEAGNPVRRQTTDSDQEYAYDAVNRITEVQRAGQTDTYAYDALGNRAAKNGAPYSYNALGEMTSSPGATYSYDAQGRRTTKTTAAGSETYAYDSFDQLTSLGAAGAIGTFGHDALDRLTHATSGSLTRTYNYGAGDSPTSVSSSDSAGLPGAGSREESFTYGPLGLEEARATGQDPSYPISDNVGNVLASVDDAGTALSGPELDPFGVRVSGSQPTGVSDPTLTFAGAFGREDLLGSDVVKMGVRAYDPEAGAFITRDSVTGRAYEPARRVAYSYAFSGPQRFADLDGRFVQVIGACVAIPACAAGIGAGIAATGAAIGITASRSDGIHLDWPEDDADSIPAPPLSSTNKDGAGGAGKPGRKPPKKPKGASVRPKVSDELGTLVNRADEIAADVLRSRGGGGDQVQFIGHYARMTLRELAERSIAKERGAKRALKIIKQAGKQGKGGK